MSGEPDKTEVQSLSEQLAILVHNSFMFDTTVHEYVSFKGTPYQKQLVIQVDRHPKKKDIWDSAYNIWKGTASK